MQVQVPGTGRRAGEPCALVGGLAAARRATPGKPLHLCHSQVFTIQQQPLHAGALPQPQAARSGTSMHFGRKAESSSALTASSRSSLRRIVHTHTLCCKFLSHLHSCFIAPNCKDITPLRRQAGTADALCVCTCRCTARCRIGAKKRELPAQQGCPPPGVPPRNGPPAGLCG